MDKAACVVESAKRRAQPAESCLILKKPGRRQKSRGHPCERGAAIIGSSDIHAAIDGDIEGEPGAGPELNQPHSARGPVIGGEEPHTPYLGGVSDAAFQFAAAPAAAEKIDQGALPFRPTITVSGTQSNGRRLARLRWWCNYGPERDPIWR